MTDKHADIRESLAKISRFPWGIDEANGCIWNVDGNRLMDLDANVDPDDAEFIANAPEYVRRLLDDNDFIAQHLNETRAAYFTLQAKNNKLEEDNQRLLNSLDTVNNILSLEREENERLRKALEEIAEDAEKYGDFHYANIANKALEEKE